MKHLHLIALILITLTATAQQHLRVLFIGNSYTYVNDLPYTISRFAAASGDTLDYSSSAPGGYTLQQHSTYAPTLSLIAQGGWDYVVLQEQSQLPSFPPAQVQQQVYPYAHTLDSLIHAADSCTETVFYMTWGKKNGDSANCPGYPQICTYSGCQDRLTASYKEMAQLNHATLAPAGEAWRRVIGQGHTFDLYQADQSHPSIYGTYLTATVFYTILFRKYAITNSYITTGITYSDAINLRQAAFATFSDSPYVWLGSGHVPVASFTAQADSQGTATFTNNSINGDTYIWDYGDGTTGTAATHTYTQSGTYTVTLTASGHCQTSRYRAIISIAIDHTGIAPTAAASHLRIYPNPAQTTLHIEHSLPQAKNTTLTLTNTLGAIVRRAEVTGTTTTLDVADLPSGVYTIQLGTVVQPVTIQH